MTVALATTAPSGPVRSQPALSEAAGPSVRPVHHPAALRPRLITRQALATPRLSDDGFFDSVVSLGLCQGHDVVLGAETSGRVKDLSYRALADMGLSVRAAWDRAAHNLLEAALHGPGYRFETRAAFGGLQVRCPGTDITSWIAHPLSFTVLHEHLQQLLGKPDAVYYSPAPDHLFVFSGQSADARLMEQTHQMAGTRADLNGCGPLIWSNGFPRVL